LLAKGHGPEADLADHDGRVAKLAVLH
jgi:hypothetical protein